MMNVVITDKSERSTVRATVDDGQTFGQLLNMFGYRADLMSVYTIRANTTGDKNLVVVEPEIVIPNLVTDIEIQYGAKC